MQKYTDEQIDAMTTEQALDVLKEGISELVNQKEVSPNVQ